MKGCDGKVVKGGGRGDRDIEEREGGMGQYIDLCC